MTKQKEVTTVVIDFHTHIFPQKIVERTISFLETQCGEKAHLSGTCDALLASMEEAGISRSIVLPVVTKPSQFDSINRFAMEVTEKTDGRLLSFGGIHPACDHLKERLQTLKRNGLIGIKLHPDYQETCFDDPGYLQILDYASELGLIISVHAGLDPGYPDFVHATPSRIRDVIHQVHPQRLVLAHMGGYMRWNEVEECLNEEDVWLDTAACFTKIPDEQFLRIVKAHGQDRILFATDSPWAGQKEFVQHFQILDLPEHAKEDILWKNAEKLLKSA